MSDDYDYQAPEDDIIEYEEDPYAAGNYEEEAGINLEDMYISAEHSMDPISEYRQIIELEKDNSSKCIWSYKSYEKLCLIYIKKKSVDEFKECFEKLFELYPRVDDFDKQDTIRNMTFNLNDESDKDLVIEILRFMLDMLKDREVDRAVMDTGLQFAKTLFYLGRNEELGELLEELLDYMERLDANDEIYKSIKLELLVMKIQYCNIMKNVKESKKLYIQAYTLNQDQIINDTRLSAIINEEGGKLHLRQKEYDFALEKFKSAFHHYEQSGNIRAKTLLKYAILSTIISRSRKNIISPEEARPYINDEKLKAMLDLLSAYEEMDISRINQVWNERISKIEDDIFILENLNEILHNIRFNYICGKLRAYKICTFSTLEKVYCDIFIYLYYRNLGLTEVISSRFSMKLF
jgi:COP9 signalosome complex subunit 2